ncbi:MAG: DUF760 domain-containing protein [Candidatus Sericytochromatia bacterium]|nr:DUF760 domain-containing protein [Candidatus Sericytochromatia bacterium]
MLRFFRIPSDDSTPGSEGNRLHRYIQSCSVQDMAKLAAEINPEVKQMIGMNVQALLGYLPSADFNTTISASKENMQSLLASAMLTGYFLHAMENRMMMENLLLDGEPGPAMKADLLRDPESLFADKADQTAEAETEPKTARQAGKFISMNELMDEIENGEEAEIQIEINAHTMDLPALLEELQSLPSFADEPQPAADEAPRQGPEAQEND